MVVAALVATVMTALTSLAATAGSVVATNIGNDVYTKGKAEAKQLFETVKARFAKEKDGALTTQALQEFVNGNADYESLIKIKLERLINTDPVFAETLTQFVQSGPLQSLIVGEEAEARRINMSNTLGAGRQETRVGNKSKVEDVNLSIE